MESQLPKPSYVTINNEKIGYYHVPAEDKPTLLLLHGFGISSIIWQEMLPYLTKHFSVFMLDFYGYGVNKELHDNITLKDQTALLENFIQTIGGVDFLLGYSYGGRVVYEYAPHLHSLIKKLFIVETPFFRSSGIKILNHFFALTGTNQHTGTTTKSIVKQSPLKEIILTAAGLVNIQDTALITKAQKMFLEEPNAQAVFSGVADLFHKFDDHKIDSIRKPIHFIYGSKDGFAKSDIVESIAEKLHSAELTIVNNVYHLLPLENPTELADLLVRSTSRQS